MAIVKTIKASNGATVHIDDSCCTGLSPEELRRRYAEIDRAIWQINYNHARRMAEASKNSSRAEPQSGGATSPRNDPEDRRGAAAACAKAQRRQCVSGKE